MIAVAVLVVGGGIALAVTSGGSPKKAPGGAAPNIPGPSTTVASQGSLCPLTGLPAPGGSVPQRPALAVKVDNYPDARPQSGIDQADIVFDEPVEGGITRFAAVFQCQSPTLIGPIRSARAVDLQIMDQLSKPILVHVGGINPVLAMLQDGNLSDFDLRTHGAIIKNVPGRVAPYDTYISAAAGWGLESNDTTPPAALFTYSTTSPTGTPVTSIHIPFTGTNNTLWTWNASGAKWLLSYSGRPATVSTGGQISTTNIVVQTVHVTYGPWLENSEGGLEVQSQMTGSGPLMVLRDGVAITGTWKTRRSRRPHHTGGVERIDHRLTTRTDLGRDRALHRAGHDHRSPVLGRSCHHRSLIAPDQKRDMQRAGPPDGNPARDHADKAG